MRNLRGRPRNISESGIVYLDSDGEDSEYSDSDVEPVFFPSAEFELGDALEEIAGDNDDDDEEQDNNANRGRFFQLIHAIDTDDESSDIEASPGQPASGTEPATRSIIQFFGGTVQVRHIIHENFTQLQQQQQQQNQSQDISSNIIEGNNEIDSSDLNRASVTLAGTVETGVANGRPVLIIEPDIVYRVQVEGNSAEASNIMTDPLSEQRSNLEENQAESSFNNKIESNEVTQAQEDATNSSGLVPYPDLPDYASAGEDDEEEFLKASIPAPYKSPSSSSEAPSSSKSRLSLKRKEPDSEDDDSESEALEKSSRKRVMENPEKLPVDQDEEEEQTCNPMVSDEECDETEEAFRGDRIGSTMYSERHVLKILMKWIEELPNYSIESLMKAREGDEADEDEKRVQRLSAEFEEQMSLLWDMSSEADVMNFLVENKIFTFIRDTIDRSACNRLTEIALGIFANVISERSIIEDFTVHDSSIQLVEKVVELCTKVTDVAILIQVFSVLRRIVWYLKNVAPVKKWTNLLQSAGFLGCSNFIMSSSRNALLLGNVMMLFFTLLDFLNPDADDDTETADVEQDSTSEKCTENRSVASTSTCKTQLAKNFEPFCESEFVPSLCEALKELMKNPKPPNIQSKLTSTREAQAGPSSGCPTEDHCPTADEIDIPIPEGHVQQAILKGISALALLQKAPNGQDALRQNAKQITNVLLDFYRTFTICTEAVTRSNSLEYFALSLHLLSFCHASLEFVNQDAITTPISTASKLMNQEVREKEVDMVIRVQLKDGVEFDSVSYIALVAHEYLAAIAERFGPDSTLMARSSSSHEHFFAVLDQVLEHFNGDEVRNNNGEGSAEAQNV